MKFEKFRIILIFIKNNLKNELKTFYRLNRNSDKEGQEGMSPLIGQRRGWRHL